MPLTLTITSYQRLSPGQESSRTLDQGRLAIGRSPDSDWVLSDPEMVLSKSHCVVENRDGDYYLTDTSTNGVFVNHGEQRVGRGQSVRLDDGDVLNLGDYEIQVRLAAAGAPTPEPPAMDYPDESSDLFSVVTEQIDLRQPPGAPKPDEIRSDSLGLDDNVVSTDDRDPLGLGTSEEPSWDQYSGDDHLPSDREYFRPPGATPEPSMDDTGPPRDEGDSAKASQNLIPDDWGEDSLIRELLPDEPPVPPSSSGEETESAVSDDEPGSATEQIPNVDDWLAQQPESESPQEPSIEPEPRPAPEPPSAAPPEPPPRPAEAPSHAVSAGDDAALRAFLRGAGLEEDLEVPSAGVPALMEQLGVIFRQTAQGMMDLLRARSSVKNEFRVERTMVGPMQNNPLKIMPTVEEAMKAMLTRHDNIWMPADRAVQEGLADIRAHELAMIAGMQAALQHLLETFDPKQLEQELGRQSRLADLLSGGRKSRYWDAFTRLYGKLAAKAEDDFQELFRQEFSRAYEEQQRKLRQR